MKKPCELERLRELRDTLVTGLVERDLPIRLALIAALAGEHLLLVGPPGTAKSLVARRLNLAFTKSDYFERLLTRFTVPEELFGPLSIKGLEEESKQLEVVKQAEQGKHDAIVAETEQLVVNNAALRQLKADQDARLSPPNLKTRVSQVIHDFNVVVIDGGAADLGVVPGSKLAVMRDGNKIAELDVNAVESRVSTATILPSTVTAGERVEAGDVVVSVRP